MSEQHTKRTPKYRKHKASGQAIVTLNGKMLYLGPWKSKASKLEYDRVIAEWLAAGRNLPTSARENEGLTVSELVLRFWEHAQTYYRHADGTPTSEVAVYKAALCPLRKLYGHTVADEFGPLSLRAVAEEMIRLGWCRNTVNKQASRIKGVFKWGVANELIDPSVYHGLQAVVGLRKGRTEATESEPVRPVPDDQIEAAIPHL